MCDIVEKLISGEMIDPVTRLPNREFIRRLEEFLERDDIWIVEVSVSLDGVDPNYRDIAVSKIASTIKHSVRIPKDLVARVGNYEFAVILGGIEEGMVKTVAKRVKDNVDYMSLSIGGKSVNPTAVVKYRKLKSGEEF